MATMSSILSAANSSAAASPAGTATAAGSAPLASESTFLQLLVTQIKNQDPTQPMDSTAFLGQLAQFSQLEQLIGINKGVQTLDGTATGTAAATTTGSTTPTTSSTTGS
jgi:flagellar basal-body rod modification protein FlgD